MDPRLLNIYNRELQYIREMGGEFAREFPKIAGRLGLEGFECADPYVERLLEGFAFLAARVQLKLEAEFPRFSQHLLEMVYPHYLAPTPSMVVAQFRPDWNEGSLKEGFTLPRGSVLQSRLGKDDQTACEYRTAHEVTLWPLELVEAEYLGTALALTTAGLALPAGVKAGIRVRLRSHAGLRVDQLALDSLSLYLRGGDSLPLRVYEQVVGNTVGLAIRPAQRPAPWQQTLDASHVHRQGFTDEQALLPYGPASFQGYRLLHEYFAFPERYLFVELTGLRPAVRRCAGDSLDIFVLLNRSDPTLEGVLGEAHLGLFCTPAINLFPKRADRIHLSDRQVEHHILPDRTRPLDFEVYQVTGVVGYGAGSVGEQAFLPFYTSHNLARPGDRGAYYTVRREPRLLSERQHRRGARSSYIGSEVFIALVDGNEAPYRADLQQLALTTLCTNRDLPLHMPVGQGKTDFTLEIGAPVEAVRCLAGPTRPRPSWAEGAATWRLLSHLSLNYLSLLDSDPQQGAIALRELLLLYSDVTEAPIRKQIEGIRSIVSQPVVRRLPIPGPIAFGRGLKITTVCDEAAFEGGSVFLLGAVLEAFFAQYVSINTFTETTIKTLNRGEIMRWPARIGRRRTL
ncbi:MAG: type VI secretion system baseplate subunit TssF [Candidatus Competibacteraceae bacterium]